MTLKSNVAVSVSEARGINVAEELTNSLLNHIHHEVVEIKGDEASAKIRGNKISGGLGLRFRDNRVDLGEDSSHEATDEGGKKIPSLVTSAC